VTLTPCPACARHVRERVCPFCGADVPAPAARPVLAGRITRAAVFSALAGCWTGSVPAEQTTPPPADTTHADSTRAAPTSGTIDGIVSDAQSGALVANARVLLDGRTSTMTDHAGHYRFTGVAAGSHSLQVTTQGNRNHGGGAFTQSTVVVDNGLVHADIPLEVTPPAFDPNSIPKPYGAPPARRRLV